MSQRAQAFGGLWSSEGAPVRQIGEKIIFVDNPDSTVTAIVRLEYTGPAQEFAWLVPLPGTPTVEVSSNTVFERLDAATAPEYWVEYTRGDMCMDAGAADAALDAEPDAGASPGISDPTAPVLVLDRGVAGPYDYVNLAVDPTLGDPVTVATDWLRANGYELTSVDSQVLSPYLKDGLNLLAFKLTKDADASAIRPVMLSYESEQPMIPIRAAAAAAQGDMPIHVWVFGPSQAVPDNYKSLVLNDATIDWLSGPRYVAGSLLAGGVGPFAPDVDMPSNYAAVVNAAVDEAGGHGFVTELAAPASQFRDKVWSPLDDEELARLHSQSYADGIDAILAANALYAGWDGFRDVLEASVALPAGVTLEALASAPEQYRGVAQVDVAKFLQALDEKVVKPVYDTAARLYGTPYLTRLYSAMSAADMTLDPTFDYNADLSQIKNVHIAKQFLPCHAGDDAPWRIELPQGGVIAGSGTGPWPVEAGTLPANLKVVQLSTSGSGTVVKDNSEEIATKLFEAAGTRGTGMAFLPAPRNGALIGGTQTVTTFVEATPTVRSEPRQGDSCGLARVEATKHSVLALWLPLAAAFLALRRSRARRQRATKRSASLLACVLLASCSDGDGAGAKVDSGSARDASAAQDASEPLPPGALTREQLRDPQTCKGCHPIHYREWSGSMHAYAARDPVFLAMNRRGQRETNGELGDFCINCHAPMAKLDGLTKDGLNLEQLPDIDRGVSCYFCHNVASVEGDHNAKVKLANDTTMRGPIRDPLQPSAHRAEFSELFESRNPKSSALCGGCHDIVTPNGVHLERTFKEYKDGIFSKSASGDPPPVDSCVGCHMPGRQEFAATAPAGVGPRTIHEHLWPGIDVPLIDFPNREAMRSAVEDCQLGVASISFFTLEVTPPDLFTFQIETNAGHNQPSGSSQDRRMWLEFLAYDEDGKLLEKVSSGNIADGEVEEKPKGDPKHDPHLLMFRDRIYDADGKPVHMFWEAAKSKAYPDGYESNVLPVATTTYIEGKRAVVKQYRASGPDGKLPARVTARLRIRPIGLDVLHDLVESGDLDPAIVAEMPTLSFGAQIEWTPARGLMKPISADVKSDCAKYRCLLDPNSNQCK